MPRTIVLLDVDHTLLYDQDKMNHALIDALLEKGINEVYLFTNMELADVRCYGLKDAPFSRMEVIAHLQSKGITVKGVITPADPYFPRPENKKDLTVDAAFKKWYTPLMEQRKETLDLNDYAAEDTLEFLFIQLEWNRSSYMLSEANRLTLDESKQIPNIGLRVVNKDPGAPEHPLQFLTLAQAKVFFITGDKAEENRKKYLLKQDYFPKSTLQVSHIMQNNDVVQDDTEKRKDQNTTLDLNDYASEDTLKFLFTELERSRSSYMLREANQLKPNESKQIPNIGLRVVNKDPGAPEHPLQFLTLDQAKVFFITGDKAEENRKKYLLRQDYFPTLKVSQETYASSDSKGTMMAHILKNSDVVKNGTNIYFFDDCKQHLAAVEAKIDEYSKINNNDVKLYTCLVPREYEKATQASQKDLYLKCLGGGEPNAIPEIIQPSITPSFWLQVLADRRMKWLAAALIIIGIAGSVAGGLGLAGIGIGVSLLLGTALTSSSAGVALIGTGLFFSSSKLKREAAIPDHNNTANCKA